VKRTSEEELKDPEILKKINSWYVPTYLLHNGINDLICVSKHYKKMRNESGTKLKNLVAQIRPEAKLS